MQNEAPRRPAVLIVDDYAHVRSALRRLLTRDYECLQAASADEAAHVLAEHHVDVVIVDVGLPDRSGIDWLAEHTAKQARARVIVMSGEQDDALVRAAYRAGAIGFVLKPFTRATLLGEIHAALSDPNREEVSRVRAEAAFSILFESARTSHAKSA